MKPCGVQFAIPMMPPERQTRRSSPATNSGRGANIRIIVQEPRIVIARGHRLIPLTQRLPSIFALRTPVEDNDLQYPSAFLLNDVSGYYFRVLGTRFEGEAVNYSPGRHAQLQEYFNQVWERSEPSEELRQLNL